MKITATVLIFAGISTVAFAADLAPTPPMGWNSCGVYGNSVREDEVKGNADFVAAHLLEHGYDYIVIDMEWYVSKGCGAEGRLYLDEYGRYLPSLCEFPSSASGKGFRPLADYVHSKGLKFGIHIMRGISRTAVEQNAPIWNSRFRAVDVADRTSSCPWYSPGRPGTYGINPTRAGAQEWYDSLLAQYAGWGVDFIKVDDISYGYHAGEIELIRNAIDRCGRPVLLSLSPGPTPIGYAGHVMRNANMWRISVDLFDQWQNPQEYTGVSPRTGQPTNETIDIWQGEMIPSLGSLYHHFELFDRWVRHAGPGHWPDGDFLVFGRLGTRSSQYGGEDHWTRLTKDEQRTLMTLWAMARSPLFFTGELRDSDAFTLSLLTNDEVLSITKASRGNGQLFRNRDQIVWTAECADGSCRYVALFNAGPERTYIQAGIKGTWRMRDLWNREEAGTARDIIRLQVPAHGARLLKLVPHSGRSK